eukprot:5470913-Pleurochrysis_carterae.AAC.1
MPECTTSAFPPTVNAIGSSVKSSRKSAKTSASYLLRTCKTARDFKWPILSRTTSSVQAVLRGANVSVCSLSLLIPTAMCSRLIGSCQLVVHHRRRWRQGGNTATTT